MSDKRIGSTHESIYKKQLSTTDRNMYRTRRLVVAWGAVSELEAAASPSAREAVEALLEEVRELAGETALLERVPALLRHRVVRVVAVVVPLAELCTLQE